MSITIINLWLSFAPQFFIMIVIMVTSNCKSIYFWCTHIVVLEDATYSYTKFNPIQ